MLNDTPKMFPFVASTMVTLLLALIPQSSVALEGEHNRLPEICQGIAGAGYTANEIASYITPVPFDIVPSAGAYTGNWALRLCPPQVNAPDGFNLEPDARDATSSDPDDRFPFATDPNCYATVLQETTKAEYDNLLGIPFRMSDWGGLGTPEVYHYNTSADIRILGSRRTDDPSTPGDETLADELKTLRDSQGRSIVRIPVGRNALTYRADTLVSLLDFPFIYIPKLPSGSKVYKELIENSGKFKRAAIKGYQAFAGAVEVVNNPVGGLVLDKIVGMSFRHGQLGVLDDIYNQDSQQVWVYDRIPPVLTTSTDTLSLPERTQAVLSYDADRDVYYLEAIHPGGIQRITGVNFLEELLSYHDHCNRQVRLSNDGGGASNFWATGSSISVNWTASDPGPVNLNGGVNTDSLLHRVEIRDSYPPVLIAPASQVVEIPVGEDDAVVEIGSPRVFDLADLTPDVDHNGPQDDTFDLGLTEVTWTASDGFNSSNAVQLINIKEEGSNTPPVADPLSVNARSDEQVEIVLTGSDGDYHPSVDRYDPLSFSIVDRPDNGFFVAPLLPFFIDDYRLEASALRFDNDLKNRDPRGYCDLRSDSEPDAWQIEYPYTPNWMAVDDDGNTMVYDEGSARCDNNDNLTVEPRLVVFDKDQNLTASREITAGGQPSDIFWDPRTNRIYVSRVDNQDDDWIYVYAPDLTQITRYNLGTGFSAPWMLDRPVAVTVDSRGIIYAATNNRINAYRQIDNNPQIAGSDAYLGTAWDDAAFAGDSIQSLATDADDNLYIGYMDRIVKLSAADVTGFDTLIPGELQGWLGYCSGNLTNEYACDTPNARSVGFACTDALCERDAVYGDQPGQFQQAKGIAVDPNDVLYVSDFGNARVQRFTPDGLFAGEARSQGVGYGFLLGDFGNPQDIQVNSNHFYVLNRDARLLHIFETTPITPIDDGSASVVYQSDSNFVGTDSFRFGVTDGLDSDEADVTIQVSRNFRPPEVPVEGQPLIAQPSLEDTPVQLVLPATDPDAAFDTLELVLIAAPEHGEVTFDGLEATYVPDPNYVGPDMFSYAVFDGREMSEETGTVELEVESVEDTPTLDVEPEREVSVGFGLLHRVDVFDPDMDETLFVTIDWGDGESTVEGHFVLDGNPIPAADAMNPDGTIRDDVETTGPILGIDPIGRGILTGDHVYTRAGAHNVQSCVFDKAQVDQETQLKSLTGASKQACSATMVTVTAAAELGIEAEVPEDPVAPGTEVEIITTLTNLEFELEPGDPRYGELPATGTPIVGLTVDGELSPHLSLLDISADGLCTLVDSATFDCTFTDLAYGETATIVARTMVEPTAPGRSEQGLAMEAQGIGLNGEVLGGGQFEIAITGLAPGLTGVSPASGNVDGYEEVTIEGVNFEQGMRVLFGGKPARQVRAIDSTTLTMLSPAQPEGVVDITVVNRDSAEATLSGAWTYESASSGGGGGGSGGGGSGGGGSGGGGSGGGSGGGTSGEGGGGGANDPAILLLLGIALLSRARQRRHSV